MTFDTLVFKIPHPNHSYTQQHTPMASLLRPPRCSMRLLAGAASGARSLHCAQPRRVADKSYQFVVCGAGAGGLAVSSSLGRKFGGGKLAVIEPADNHYYQSLWTLVGGGVKTVENSWRSMSDVMPPQADWLKTKVEEFRPEETVVVTADGSKVKYDYLIVAVGMKVDFERVKGLPEALSDPHSMVSSNYSPVYAPKTFENVKRFRGGHALFTCPTMPINCPGAPQKIMYMADDYWRQCGVRESSTISYNTALRVIFIAKKYAQQLLRVVERKDIQVNYQHNLVEVRKDKREAVFQLLARGKEGETVTVEYDFLHVAPPMCPLDMMKGQPITDELGWVDVNGRTLQHKKYENIFALGDCSNVPTSKTAAAVASESAVLKRNLYEVMKGSTPTHQYDGYTSCPLITGYGKAILAEFDFDTMPLETFPFDQGEERRSMYHLKRDLLPKVYWHGLLRGLWGGPNVARSILHLTDHTK